MRTYWHPDVGPWVADHLEYGGPYNGPDCLCMGVEHKGELIAGCVFHNYDPDAKMMELSVASTRPGRWATREVLNELGDYAFGYVGVQMLYARHREDNHAARGLWRKLGAEEYIVPRLFGRGTTGALAFLSDDAWYASKFYREPYEWAENQAAAQ